MLYILLSQSGEVILFVLKKRERQPLKLSLKLYNE